MSKSTDWKVEVKQSDGSYVDDGYIQRPNDDMETVLTSNTKRMVMADGSHGYITPETKSVKEIINMTFIDTTSSFRNKIAGYINNASFLRITTHTNEQFTGYFQSMSRIWLVGMSDTYDVQLVFEQE